MDFYSVVLGKGTGIGHKIIIFVQPSISLTATADRLTLIAPGYHNSAPKM
jgi:hypothetical protein